MSEDRASRSSGRKKLFGETFIEIDNYNHTGKLPAGSIVIGRMLSLCKHKRGTPSLSRDEASKIVANELRIYLINKNLYPMVEKAVAKKVKNVYERFNALRKVENCSGKSKSETWYKKATEFRDQLTLHAYDIRCKDEIFQRPMEEDFGVKNDKRRSNLLPR